jgi:hypothetical protein
MLRRVMLGAALGCSVSGCSLGLYLDEQRAEALLAEIEALAADKSSTSDADCGVVAVGAKACGGPETWCILAPPPMKNCSWTKSGSIRSFGST